MTITRTRIPRTIRVVPDAVAIDITEVQALRRPLDRGPPIRQALKGIIPKILIKIISYYTYHWLTFFKIMGDIIGDPELFPSCRAMPGEDIGFHQLGDDSILGHMAQIGVHSESPS